MSRRLSPKRRSQSVHTLKQAQNLYRDLGRILSTDRTVSAAYRAEAKDVRRDLEDIYGDVVRATSAERYATSMRGGFGVVLPTWSMRAQGAFDKPQIKAAPYLAYIVYQPDTGEAVGTYTDLSQATFAGLRVLEDTLTQKRRESPRAFRERQLDAQIGALDDLLGTSRRPGTLRQTAADLEQLRTRLQTEKARIERAKKTGEAGWEGREAD